MEFISFPQTLHLLQVNNQTTASVTAKIISEQSANSHCDSNYLLISFQAAWRVSLVLWKNWFFLRRQSCKPERHKVLYSRCNERCLHFYTAFWILLGNNAEHFRQSHLNDTNYFSWSQNKYIFNFVQNSLRYVAPSTNHDRDIGGFFIHHCFSKFKQSNFMLERLETMGIKA